MNTYQPAAQTLWHFRIDPEAGSRKLQWHQQVQCIPISEIDTHQTEEAVAKFAFLGYACEAGVARNNGRIGTKDAPDTIRKQMAKLALNQPDVWLHDFGNLHCDGDQMEKTQENTASILSSLLSGKYLPILLGGGHDMAWAHFLGITHFLEKNHREKTVGIINLDAHFDLRKPVQFTHSGTPFYQIKEWCDTHQKPFYYMCLGIQQASNSPLLFERADAWQVTYHDHTACQLSNIENIRKKLTDFMAKVDCIYLTIDLDAFSSAFAPGVSAASPLGITPEFAIRIIQIVQNSGKLLSVDLAELNPRFDRDNQTALLAARLIHTVVHHTVR
ncbi:MAG: formimidoylglutamase [Flavobacteriaceae bacterium]|nr:formimidoylglutamase [Flavobacteriaceae bacterium]